MKRRSRVRGFRIAGYLLLVPTWAMIAFISIDALGRYTSVGDVTLVALIMLFAGWAWWYSEDRDRRKATAVMGSHDGNPGPKAGDGR